MSDHTCILKFHLPFDSDERLWNSCSARAFIERAHKWIQHVLVKVQQKGGEKRVRQTNKGLTKKGGKSGRLFLGEAGVHCESATLHHTCVVKGRGDGTSSNFRNLGSACETKKTQSDLRFCENEELKRFKMNEKGDQLDWKLRENLYKLLKIC